MENKEAAKKLSGVSHSSGANFPDSIHAVTKAETSSPGTPTNTPKLSLTRGDEHASSSPNSDTAPTSCDYLKATSKFQAANPSSTTCAIITNTPASQAISKPRAKYCLLHHYCNHTTNDGHHTRCLTDMERKRYRDEVNSKAVSVLQPKTEIPRTEVVPRSSPVVHLAKPDAPTPSLTRKADIPSKPEDTPWIQVKSHKRRQQKTTTLAPNNLKFKSSLPVIAEDSDEDSTKDSTCMLAKVLAEVLVGSNHSLTVPKVTILQRSLPHKVPATSVTLSSPPRPKGPPTVASKLATSALKPGHNLSPRRPPAVVIKSNVKPNLSKEPHKVTILKRPLQSSVRDTTVTKSESSLRHKGPPAAGKANP